MSNPRLREELLELETVTPELEAKYRMQMKAILERPLTPVSRIGTIIGLVMGIGFFLSFSTVTVITLLLEPDFPAIGRLIFAAGALFGLAFAVLSAVILKRGSINLQLWRNITLRQLRTMHPAAFGLTWGFCVLLTVGCMMMGHQMADPARGNQIILGGIVAMVLFGIPVMILSVATESELLMREKFLQLELRLAELRALLAAERDSDARRIREDEGHEA
ncbi:MAG: hypothetical protein KA184_13925 [Candidatus Hydrogenedentes bacterium]|nr:hypothetical protein [Candidatus Hydrogenedentota bacterium]